MSQIHIASTADYLLKIFQACLDPKICFKKFLLLKKNFGRIQVKKNIGDGQM